MAPGPQRPGWVCSAQAARRWNTQLWRPANATRSSWTNTCRGLKSSGSGSAQGGDALADGDSGAKSNADLRAELDKVKNRKKGKGKGTSTTIELGKPSREPQQTPASFGGWRPWLDTVLTSAATNSPLVQLIASATADNLQFSRRVFLHQQFFPAWRSHARQSSHERSPSAPTGGCSTRHGCHGRFALVRAGSRLFICDWLPAFLRHSDHAWKAYLEAREGSESPGSRLRMGPRTRPPQRHSQRAGGPRTPSSRN